MINIQMITIQCFDDIQSQCKHSFCTNQISNKLPRAWTKEEDDFLKFILCKSSWIRIVDQNSIEKLFSA